MDFGTGWRGILVLTVLPVLVKLHLVLGIYQASPIYLFSGLLPLLPVMAAHSSIDFNVGVVSQALGHRAALDLLNGIMPWWNPFEGVGTPLAGEMQSAALLPLTVLLAFPNGQLAMHLLFQIIAGVFTFLLMRRMGVSGFAAFIAGVLFEFNGTYAWMANAVINPIAFLPVILFGVEGVRAGIAGAWRWIAIGIAVSLYAGFPETAYIDGLLVAVWTASRAWGLSRQQLPPTALRIALGLLVGLLLSAPIMLAFLDYLPNANVLYHQKGFLSYFHIPRSFAVAQFLPYAYGLVDSPANIGTLVRLWGNVGGYTGIGLIALAVLGLLGSTNKALRAALVLWAGLSWAAAYGVAVGRIIEFIPGIPNTDFARYHDASSSMALVVLAGFALDDMAKETRIGWRYWIAIGITGLLLVISILAATGTLGPITKTLSVQASAAFGLGIFAALVYIGGSRGPMQKRCIWLGFLVATETILNFSVPTFANAQHAKLPLQGIAFLQAHLGYQRMYSMGVLEPNYGSYFGIAEIDDCDLPIPAKWLDFRNRRLDPYAFTLDFDGAARNSFNAPTAREELNKNLSQYLAVGVKYVVAKPAADPFNASSMAAGIAQKVYADPTMTIYELAHPRPYFDAPTCKVAARSRNLAVVNCPTSSALTRLELFMPGWRVWVNGKAQPISETGEIFQLVHLPPGLSEVRFRFRPPFMLLGYVAFILGLLLLTAHPRRRLLSPTDPTKMYRWVKPLLRRGTQ